MLRQERCNIQTQFPHTRTHTHTHTPWQIYGTQFEYIQSWNLLVGFLPRAQQPPPALDLYMGPMWGLEQL